MRLRGFLRAPFLRAVAWTAALVVICTVLFEGYLWFRGIDLRAYRLGSNDSFASLRIVAGGAFILILPGLLLSYVFFPYHARSPDHGPDALDAIERCTLACTLSLAVVPLLIYTTNRLGVPISSRSIVMEVGVLVIGSVMGCIWRLRRTSKDSATG